MLPIHPYSLSSSTLFSYYFPLIYHPAVFYSHFLSFMNLHIPFLSILARIFFFSFFLLFEFLPYPFLYPSFVFLNPVLLLSFVFHFISFIFLCYETFPFFSCFHASYRRARIFLLFFSSFMNILLFIHPAVKHVFLLFSFLLFYHMLPYPSSVFLNPVLLFPLPYPSSFFFPLILPLISLIVFVFFHILIFSIFRLPFRFIHPALKHVFSFFLSFFYEFFTISMLPYPSSVFCICSLIVLLPFTYSFFLYYETIFFFFSFSVFYIFFFFFSSLFISFISICHIHLLSSSTLSLIVLCPYHIYVFSLARIFFFFFFFMNAYLIHVAISIFCLSFVLLLSFVSSHILIFSIIYPFYRFYTSCRRARIFFFSFFFYECFTISFIAISIFFCLPQPCSLILSLSSFTYSHFLYLRRSLFFYILS
ncbi:unnamed protein product [Acanthosepion pharaonis]|uniref:Uncharacterized protein n=1 Tax=Acanthosepion pharaonis TaxID=158019 RepID=A0A812E1B2_ACAPH|nr:unnamed protein product [Sepia pharaonis]